MTAKNMPNEQEQPKQPTPAGHDHDHRGAFGALRTAYEVVAHPVRKVCYEPLAAHYERKYRSKYPQHHSKILILDLTLMFIAGGLTVFWIFANSILPLIPVPALVHIEVLAPATIVSGATTDYVVSFQNDSPQELSCAQLRIILPADTVLETEPLKTEKSEKTCFVEPGERPMLMDPSRPDVHVIELGVIEPHGSDAVHIKARTYGASGSIKMMTAELTYWEAGATQPTRIASRNEWDVTGSTLALDLTAPDVGARGQVRTLTLSYENRGDVPLAGTIIRLSTPEDFTITGSSPAASARREWRVGRLEPGDKGSIAVYGYFRPAASDVATTFAARGYVEAGGKLTLAELVRKNADPGAADVELASVIVEPAGREALLPGEQVRVRVSYRNASAHALRDMRIVLDPGSEAAENFSPEGLTWDASNAPELAEVTAGEKGELTASFTVPPIIPPGGAPPALHLSARAHYAVEGETEPVRIDTDVQDLPIATNLRIAGTALYYTKDGDQLGIGPLPPKVGETTKYRVFLSLSTTTGAVEGAVVEAVLAPNVAWTGNASVTAGDSLDHFVSTGRLRWTVGAVPAGAGDEFKIGATFEVAITPDKDTAGSAPLLLKGIKVTGVDAATGLPLHAAAENISTDLPYDQRAAGKGTVVE